MSGLRVVCLGCGDAFSARWYSSCLAVESDGVWLLVDCPHPIRKILRESGHEAGEALDIDRFSGVVLTHLHADHASGLEGWGYYSYYHLNRRATLLTHREVSAQLWEHHLSASMGTIPAPGDEPQPMLADLSTYFDLRPLSDEAPVSLGPFAIECRRTRHSIPTFALRIRAGGRCLAYSADTPFDPSLIDWLADGSDLIVHETNRGARVHTPYEPLAALPDDVRSRLRIIHYPDDFDLASSVIEPIVQGRKYDV